MKSNAKHYNLTSKESLNELSKEELVEAVLLLGAKVQQLSDSVRDLVQAKYGPKNERFEDPNQLNIFPKPESNQSSGSGDKKPKGTKKPDKVEGHSRNPFPSNLPRKKIYASLPPGQVNCVCCGSAYEAIREFLQRTRLQYSPATFLVEELIGRVFSCSQCQNEVTANVPEPIKNSIAAASLMAQVAVAKGQDHIPFNRQSSIYARAGVHLHRSTLSDLFAHTASILRPLYELMHQEILQSRVIWTDDTPVKVKDPSKDKNIKLGRLWIYFGDDEHTFSVIDYTTGRGRDGPLTFLAGYEGFLQGDCFSGNLAVCAANDTILVACLAHARRYFVKALLNDKDGCNTALGMFQALYEIERSVKELELAPPSIKKMREEEAKPILKEFHSWLLEQYKFAQPKSSFGKALFYCLNNWKELNQYVEHGCLSIDNNVSEREMKYIAMGRRAWLFLGSDVGGKNHAIVLSLIATCRRHGVEPWAYLTDVIQRLTDGFDEKIEDLLPNRWKPKMTASPPAEIKASEPTPKVRKEELATQNALPALGIAI